METFINFFIRFRKIVLVIMGLMTAFFITQIARMEMFTQFLDLFPSNHPYVKVHKEYARRLRHGLAGHPHARGEKRGRLQPDDTDKLQKIHYDVDLIPGINHYSVMDVASPKCHYTYETPFGFAIRQYDARYHRRRTRK